MSKTKKSIKATNRHHSRFWLYLVFSLVILALGYSLLHYLDSLAGFRAKPFNVVKPLSRPVLNPKALISPANVKKSYNLEGKGEGKGTIAIVVAYRNPNTESDLATFSSQFGLKSCTKANGCLEVVPMANGIAVNQDWAIEEALDVQWAHAIAPGAKKLIVQAKSASGNDLLAAVNYARNRSDVVAVSMSWGGNEFSSEGLYESYFTSPYGATFFAASGDNGYGTSWPSVSANVVSVGGTTLNVSNTGSFISETAWSGSGGGRSSYVAQPSYQKTYGVASATNKRATPDVSYNANPSTGYAVYSSTPYRGYKGWFQVGGTSAGAPQWAAMAAIASPTNVNHGKIYSAAKLPAQNRLRDIISGKNGNCLIYCSAQIGYDYVTGLGSPLSTSF